MEWLQKNENIDFLCQNRYNINQLKLFGYSMRLREVKWEAKGQSYH